MTEQQRDVSSHAPLLQRLRGQAFLPGVHYASQAEVWMREAADEIEALSYAIDHLLNAISAKAAPDLMAAAITEAERARGYVGK